MGLIKEWLNRIGLSEQYPKFEEAGIVHPKHFLTLDASSFESLGVASEDDQRKLILLCKRVKEAEKRSRQSVGGTMSESFLAENGELRADGGSEDAVGKEKKTDIAVKTNLRTMQPRRSRRLATKTQDLTSGNGSSIVFPSLAAAISPKAQASSYKKESKSTASSPVKSPVNKKLHMKDERPSMNDGVDLNAEESDFSDSKTSKERRKSRTSTAPPASRRGAPASKLPGSLRTGKNLSAIPSESAAPPSPLVEFSSSDLNEEIENLDDKLTRKEFVSKLSRKPSAGGKRRATLAGNGDELDELLQSSASESSVGIKLDAVLADVSDSGSESAASSTHRRRQRQIPKLNKNRPSKSMSVGELTYLKQHQAQEQTITRSPISTRAITRPLVNRRQSSSLSQEDCVSAKTMPTVPIVQGMNEPESWAEQIESLREDNEAEYDLFRDQLDCDQQQYLDMRIKVIVRKRPMSKSEASRAGGLDIIHPLDYGDFGKIFVYQPKTRVDLTKEVETISFAYDSVYGEESTNKEIYNRSLRNLIRPFLDGQWATCFAYGQTGSGKTYTMMGSNVTGINAGTATIDASNLGLYYLAALEIFELLKEPQYDHLNLHVSLFEIYGGGKLFDLLNSRELIKCLENSRGQVCFPGLTQHPVNSPREVMELIEQGAENRSTGTTSRNADSSRSHAVLQLKLVKKVGRKADVEHSRFSFIDLAGSERGADTSNASKTTRLEGADINTSLLALKEVIRALATGGSMTHIPFRGSKLTQVLKDSFVGDNARCCMVACISPDIGNCEQTLNTLRYADRVKERNPENGALSSSCEQPTRVVDVKPSIDVLASEEKKSNPFNQPVYRMSPKTSNQDNATDCVVSTGRQLVADHKEITKTWLAMLGSETQLIQDATDEEGWQAYYDQFEEYQATELAFVTKLRASLQAYIDERAASNQSAMIDDSRTSSDDESFEDLRD